MNKFACQQLFTCVLITCMYTLVPVVQVAAQQVTIYGKFNWDIYSTRGISGAVASGKGNHGNISTQGSITQNTYKITSLSNTSGLLPGMKISGTGIPVNATAVDVSGTTVLISKMITAASATGVNLTINNENATLVTAHADGLGGSLPGFATYTLDSGVNYIFNGATIKPFPEQANAAATRIYTGKLTVNANTSINKQVYTSDTLTLTSGNLTIPPADSLIITSGTAIAGYPFSSTKHIITSVNADSSSQGFLGANNINAAYLFPVGTAAHYLPVTITPVSNDAFIISAFEGITTNSQPGGTAFTPQQKEKLVNATWTILRTSSSIDSCSVTLGWPQAIEGSSFSMADSIGIITYDTAWSCASGAGDNTTNTATGIFTAFSAFAVSSKGDTAGSLLVFIPRNKEKVTLKHLAGELLLNNIYPNPASGLLTVEYPLSQSRALITIYDMSGRAIHKEYTNTKKTQLQIGALKAGIYTLTVFDGVNTASKKFIKGE